MRKKFLFLLFVLIVCSLSNGAGVLGEIKRMEKGALNQAFSFYTCLKHSGIRTDLVVRAKSVLNAALYTANLTWETRYYSALALDRLGEESKVIQEAIIIGFENAFPLIRGVYKNFGLRDVEDIRGIQKPNHTMASFIISLAEYSSDQKAATQALSIVASWGDKTWAIREFLNSKKLLLVEIGRAHIKFWKKNIQEGEGKQVARYVEKLQYLKLAEDTLFKFVDWWPELDEVESPFEKVYAAALSSENLAEVEEAIRFLLSLPTLKIETIALLDKVRKQPNISPDLQKQIDCIRFIIGKKAN